MALLSSLAGGFADPRALGALLLLLARLLPLCLLAPFVAVRGASVMVSLAVAAALALGLWPVALAASPGLSPTAATLLPALLGELLVGGLFAFTLSLPFWALGWAGELWARWGGLPGEAHPDSAPGPFAELARLLAVLAFFAAGGPTALLGGLSDGLRALPPGVAPALLHDGAAWLGAARATASALSLALSLALPLALCLWLFEALLGALQRGVAGLAVASFAVPLRASVSLGVVLLSLALLLSRLPAVFRETLAAAARLWS